MNKSILLSSVTLVAIAAYTLIFKSDNRVIDPGYIKPSRECFQPDDLIIKFGSLNETTLPELIADEYHSAGLSLTQQQKLEISDWSTSVVFNLLQRRFEWNLYDPEFCEQANISIRDADTDTLKLQYQHQFCNSFLNDDSVVDYHWKYYKNGVRFSIAVCPVVRKAAGVVPYYHVETNSTEKYELGMILSMMKYYVDTEVHLAFTIGDKINRKLIYEDGAILYTSLMVPEPPVE